MQQQQPQQGYMPQQQAITQKPGPQQQLKFYKSGLFGFSSAPGRMQRDSYRMQQDGYQLQFAAYLGTNFWWQRTIVATWVKSL